MYSVARCPDGMSSACPISAFEFRVQGSGFRVQGSGFRVQDLGFRVRVEGLGGRARIEPPAALLPRLAHLQFCKLALLRNARPFVSNPHKNNYYAEK